MFATNEIISQCYIKTSTHVLSSIAERYIFHCKGFPGYFWDTPDDHSLFIQMTRGYPLRVIPGLTGQRGTVSFQDPFNENRYIRHYQYLLDIESRVDPRDPETFNDDATFILYKHKWFLGYFSFASVNFPNHYIRHHNFRLSLHELIDTTSFHMTASFQAIPA